MSYHGQHVGSRWLDARPEVIVVHDDFALGAAVVRFQHFNRHLVAEILGFCFKTNETNCYKLRQK